jgi:hypothetical protein
MNSTQPAYFGEIVASSLTTWTVQCWQLDTYPAFGSLIFLEYDGKCSFGIVSSIQTHSKDSSRTPFAFGKTLQELKQEQPHIFQLLTSTLTCIPLSYSENNLIIHEIPKRPAPIHTFAGACSTDLLKIFFENSSWMIPFFNLAQQNPLFDELLIALLRNGYEHRALSQESLQEIIDIFSLLTHDDYRKLKIFLQRIEVFIH